MFQTDQKTTLPWLCGGIEWQIHTKKLFIREGSVKRREETQMEDFYYASLYDILQRPIQHAERSLTINRLKAKIVKLHDARLARG